MGLVWGVIHHASAAAGGTKIHHFVGTEGFCKLMYVWERRVLLGEVRAERKKLDYDEYFEYWKTRWFSLVFVQDMHKNSTCLCKSTKPPEFILLDPKLRAMMPGWGGQIPRRGVIPRHCFQKCLSEMPLKCMWKMWTVWGTFASKGSGGIYRWLIGSTLTPGWLRCRAVQQQVLRLAVWWWRVWSLGLV